VLNLINLKRDVNAKTIVNCVNLDNYFTLPNYSGIFFKTYSRTNEHEIQKCSFCL